jgi:D-aminopeptidase
MNAPSKPSDSQKCLIEQLDALFEPWARSTGPGLVVGVARANRILYRRGLGMASLESGSANTPATRMRIGSVSKHFTCLLALLLAQEGKLSLDAPIRTYLPELAGPGGDPTLRELMLHRGGSRCHLDVGMLCHGTAPWPAGAPLEFYVRQSGRNFPPGEAMIYCNGGYYLLSLAIERAGNASFEDQLADRLFGPLGMLDTASVRSDYIITPGIATLHVPLGAGQWRRGLFISEDLRGEGGIVSTVDDMLRWLSHLREPTRIGSPAMWQALGTPAEGAEASDDFYALGLRFADYRGVRTIGHSGGVIGGSSQILTVPGHALDIVILTNGAAEADPTELANRVLDLALAEHLDAPTAALSAKDFGEFLGDWWSPVTGMVYNLGDDDGRLTLKAFYGPHGIELRRDASGALYWPEAGIGDLSFSFDGGNEDRLIARFGSRREELERLPRGAPKIPTTSFAGLVGRYLSPEADATATISQEDGQLAIRFSDWYGGTHSPLTFLNDRLACAGPFAAVIWCALLFERRDGLATAFSVNSVRTRNLKFQRIR